VATINLNSLNQSIRTMVENMVKQAVNDTLADMLGNEPTAERKPEPWGKRTNSGPPEPSKRVGKAEPTQDRRNGPRVVYAVRKGRGGKMPNPEFGGFRTAEKTWKAISKARGPVTKPQIMAASGLGKKTVESCIHHLIHLGVIESQPVD
jgi:hypothetical protein